MDVNELPYPMPTNKKVWLTHRLPIANQLPVGVYLHVDQRSASLHYRIMHLILNSSMYELFVDSTTNDIPVISDKSDDPLTVVKEYIEGNYCTINLGQFVMGHFLVVLGPSSFPI